MGYARNDERIGGASPIARGDFGEKEEIGGIDGVVLDGYWMAGEG
jgi:hypothetical protein